MVEVSTATVSADPAVTSFAISVDSSSGTVPSFLNGTTVVGAEVFETTAGMECTDPETDDGTVIAGDGAGVTEGTDVADVTEGMVAPASGEVDSAIAGAGISTSSASWVSCSRCACGKRGKTMCET